MKYTDCLAMDLRSLRGKVLQLGIEIVKKRSSFVAGEIKIKPHEIRLIKKNIARLNTAFSLKRKQIKSQS